VDGAHARRQSRDHEYWLRQVMDPVRFAAGMRVLDADGVTAYIEIRSASGPGHMGRRSVRDDATAAWLPSLKKGAPEWPSILASAGELYTRGAELDWRGFDAPYARQRVPVPGYAFEEKEYWLTQIPAAKVPRPQAAQIGAAEGTRAVGLRPDVGAPAARRGRRRWCSCGHLGRSRRRARCRHGDRGGATGQGRGRCGGAQRRGRTTGLRHGSRAGVAPRVVDVRALDLPERVQRDGLASIAGSHLGGLAQIVTTVAASAKAPSLWIVTRGAVVAGPGADAPPLSPVQRALWGFARTVALEHPEAWGAIIDVDAGNAQTVAARVVAELLSDGPEDQVALRGSERYVPRLVPRPETQAAPLQLDANATYLVTGGLGALGLHAARWLVARGARHLVLASRRAPNAAATAQMAALQAAGVNVAIVAADVSTAEAWPICSQGPASSGR
jgi:acyl transferase domain-containing protein